MRLLLRLLLLLWLLLLTRRDLLRWSLLLLHVASCSSTFQNRSSLRFRQRHMLLLLLLRW